jgi:hypothetical protein
LFFASVSKGLIPKFKEEGEMTHLKQLFVVLMGSLLLAGTAFAQVDRGTITGIVTDQSGAVVPGVAITITNISTGVTNNMVSNGAGVYVAPLLPAAVYKLVAEKEGFKTFTQTNILVRVGDTTRLDVALSLGSKTETVMVTAEAPLLERESSDTGTTVTSREVEDLPLVAEGDQRSPAFFMQLAPGVTGRGSNDGGPGNNRTMDTQVSGSMVSSTTLMLDGADIPSQWEFEGDLRGLQIPPDAIGEFKLEATNASAEYGRSGGGSVSFEVKSGTNGLHGTAYEFVRNDDMDARNFFAPQVNTNKQNEYGVTAGGPIRKNKLFVFGWFDGFKLVAGASSGTSTVPTAQMIQGDFTQLDKYPSVYDAVLYDPASVAAGSPSTCPKDPVTGAPNGIICNNMILSQTSISPISAKINPYMPKPNINQGTPDAIFNNFYSTVENPISIKMYGFKGDYNINERNRLSVLYDYGINLTPNNGGWPAPLGGGTWPSYNKTRNGRVNWNLMLKPNINNHAVASYNFWGGGTTPESTYGGKSDWVDYLGLKGFDPGLKTQFPQIVIDLPTQLASSFNGGGEEGLDDGHSSEVADTVTWIKGKHTVKFGMEYLKGAGNDINPGRTAGWFGFTNAMTGIASNPATGSGFASYLLGYAASVNDTVYTAPSYARNGYFGLFVQDDYKLTKKLTVNLGLRYDLFIPDYHKYGTKSWMDPTLPNPGAPGEFGAMAYGFSAPLRSGVYTHHHNFAPRVGLAYSLNDKTVIRAAYGIYFAQGNTNRLDRGTYVQGYNVNPSVGTLGQQLPAFQWDGNCPSWATGCLGVFPTTGSGFVPSLTPTAENGSSPYMTDPSDGVSPYAQNFQIGIQRQLPGQITLTVSYVGNTGVHLSSLLMPTTQMPPQYLTSLGNLLGSDGVTPLLFSPLSDPLVQAQLTSEPVDPATGNHSPFPGFEALYGSSSNNSLGKALSIHPQYNKLDRGYEGVATSTYNALQVKAEKRFSNGLSLLLSYAFSKNLTNGGSIFGVFSSEFGTTDPWSAHSQKSYNFNDMPQIASFAYVYDLPVGLGRHFLNHPGVVNQIIGGWKVSGVQQYQSGEPESIQDGVTARALEQEDGFNTPDTISGVPEKTAAKAHGPFDPAINAEFNNHAFQYACQFCFGTMTPTEATVRAFGYFDEDFSLLKDWRLHESWVLNFHIDAINAFNRVQFVQYQGSGGYAAEPSIAGPGADQFGYVGAMGNPPRTIQLGMRLKW